MSQFSNYFQQISQIAAKGNATEHTYRPALKTLLESLAPGIVATNEPKRIKCGAPDYILTHGETPLGYVEAKDVGEPLEKIEKTDQMRRYLESLGNLILTDYVEFRWYVGGQHRLTARLGTGGGKKPLTAGLKGEAEIKALLNAFLETTAPTVSGPKELAGRMANLAKLVRDTISRALGDEDKGGTLHQQFEGFRKVLLHDLTPEAFADMYAQTIAYGLFAARCNSKPGQRFSRVLAPHQLPKTNPFLRKTFGYIAGPDLDERVVWVVDDLAELLDRADMEAILKDFGHRTRQEDPVVHFYETFLGAYDPKMREARGVYYTPEPVVSYIVRSVDALLKSDFGLTEGLADAEKITVKTPDGKGTTEVHRVQILDPATGTGTFLHGVVDHIAATYTDNKGMWSGYVTDHLLPRLFGFELLMAPYAVAHLKLGLQLAESGYDFASDERLGVYLTNTLDEANQAEGMTLFAQWVVEEANAAGQVKQDVPVMVIMGNPPYSVSSQNKGEWIVKLLEDYKQDLNEKKLNLDDDFIKFFRFAQWRIEQTGYGILAFISNNTYLDGITHRRMRESLMETFDDIYVLDLHGSSKKKERAPDGSKDENVFDIQQGVSIGIFVKKPGKSPDCAVHHAELWGKRKNKYEYLFDNDVATTQWEPMQNIAQKSCLGQFFFFTPKAFDNIDEYCEGWGLSEISEGISGVETKRDHFAIDYEQNTLKQRITDFVEGRYTDEERKERFQVRDNEWNVADAVKTLRADDSWKYSFVPCLYRAFDMRWIVYNDTILSRDRGSLMAGMTRANIGLVAARQSKEPFAVLATDSVCCHKIVTVYDRSFLFPLYLYPTSKQAHLFDETEDKPDKRIANLAPEFIADFAAKLGLDFVPNGHGDRQATFGPEDVFDYLYAVFHSPAYRARYAEFLKIDFPRLPLTSQPALFQALGVLGSELVSLHLMEKKGPATITYPIPLPNSDSAKDRVEAVSYAEPTGSNRGRVYINKTQYFDGVTPEVWNFQVGGYQVCHKWLKDRKGRTLAFDDIKHYAQVVSALGETIRLMAAIDKTINAQGGWPLT